MPIAPKGFKDWTEAVQWMTKQLGTTDEEFETIVKAKQDAAWEASANAQEAMSLDVFDRVAKAMKRGDNFKDFKAGLGDTIKGMWGKGVNEGARLENIWRTEAQKAYNAARYSWQTKPGRLKLYPFWRFDAILDSRTSVMCQHWDGTIRKATDSFWGSHYPPLHYQCRSSVVAMTKKTAQGLGGQTRIVEDDEVEPLPGFGNPADLTKESKDAGTNRKAKPDKAIKRERKAKKNPGPTPKQRRQINSVLEAIRKRRKELERG
jgi:SPP1 gp7 family putative phage head morphogenesis protein